jgi:hypothetical protein
MSESDAETEVLIVRARDGDATARQQLLAHYQQRLRQMIAVRLDRRLAARRIQPGAVEGVRGEDEP